MHTSVSPIHTVIFIIYLKEINENILQVHGLWYNLIISASVCVKQTYLRPQTTNCVANAANVASDGKVKNISKTKGLVKHNIQDVINKCFFFNIFIVACKYIFVRSDDEFAWMGLQKVYL